MGGGSKSAIIDSAQNVSTLKPPVVWSLYRIFLRCRLIVPLQPPRNFVAPFPFWRGTTRTGLALAHRNK
jgi:hypothetical protein